MLPTRQAGIRLQKYLADKGLGSRRKIETWITEGKIKVDGRLAKLGDRVTEESRISIDGRPLKKERADHRRSRSVETRFSETRVGGTRVIAYNKPEGEICSRDDPGNRPTVFRRLPKLRGSRWVVVGRLDINTRGLLLFTNNGDLANQLMHPKLGFEREYMCRVFGKVDDKALQRLTDGISLDGETARFSNVKRERGEGRNTWYSVVISEGRYREVRRMWESIGCQVSRLVRVRYGSVTLPRQLRAGETMELKPAAVSKLFVQQDIEQSTDPTDDQIPVANNRRSGSGRNTDRRSKGTRARSSKKATDEAKTGQSRSRGGSARGKVASIKAPAGNLGKVPGSKPGRNKSGGQTGKKKTRR